MDTNRSYELVGISVNELSVELDQLWNELKTDSQLRRRAEEVGIDFDQLRPLERSQAVTVEREGAGLDPATTAVIVAFAPVIAQIVADLWEHVLLPSTTTRIRNVV